MGNSIYNQTHETKQHNEQQILNEQARINFNKRVKSYSYPHHGDYIQYIEYCHGQYELECIPQSCRRGSYYNR
jgi:hypothetical protein